jgi:hypothetical protein
MAFRGFKSDVSFPPTWIGDIVGGEGGDALRKSPGYRIARLYA